MLGSYTCITSNVIYAITCTRCEKIYIGETKRRLADRFNELLRSIKLNFPGLPVGAHFNSSGHSIYNAMVSVVTCCIMTLFSKLLQKGYKKPSRRRLICRKAEEERLIYNHGTLEPSGMNVRFHSFPVSIETPLLYKQHIYLIPCFCVL